MTSSERHPSQRLLERSQLEAVLAPYAALAPHLHWSVLRPDGSLVAQAGAAGTADAAGRCFPLMAEGAEAGTLVMRGGTAERDIQLASAVGQTLNVLLAETLARRGMAAEALERYRELNLLYRTNEALGGTLDPDAVLRLLLAECGRAVPSDSSLVLFSGSAPGVPWQLKAQSGFDARLEALDAPVLDLLAQVGASGRADMRAGSFALPDGAAPWQALLCAPLRAKSRALGVVLLARGAGKPEFSASDEKLLVALTGQVGIALDNAFLHQSALNAERLEHELRLAYDVQASLIPHHVPQSDGWDFAAWWQPAREVSGDFYDFIAMPGALGVVVGDVTDKGMPSALFMANTRSVIRASTTVGRTPAESLDHANRLLCADSVDSMFVTLFYARLDLRTRTLTYVNGGHNPPLWYTRRQSEPLPLKRTGIILGVDDGAQFGEACIQLEPGDVVVLYTDGLTEALNAAGERFTEARLRQVLAARRDAAAAEILAATQAALREFTGATPAYDDVTLVVVRCA